MLLKYGGYDTNMETALCKCQWNIADRRGVDIVIKSMEPYEKI
jgi:hypothetical protein